LAILGEREQWSEERAPGPQGIASLAFPREPDSVRCGPSSLKERSLRRRATSRIHAVADGGTESRRVRPRLVDPVRERMEEALNLSCEAPSEWRMQYIKCHHFDEKRRCDRLLVVIVPILHHSHEGLPFAVVCLVRVH